MRVYSDPDPVSTPDRHVSQALRRIDPGLYLVYKRFICDTHGNALKDTKTGMLARRPRWHVYLDHASGEQHWLFAVEDREGGHQHPTMSVPERILGDVARHASANEIEDMLRNAEEEKTNKDAKNMEDLRDEMFKANKGKLREMLSDVNNIHGEGSGPQENKRARKIVSYDGQKNRSTPDDNTIDLTPEEDGWEIPDWEKEMN